MASGRERPPPRLRRCLKVPVSMIVPPYVRRPTMAARHLSRWRHAVSGPGRPVVPSGGQLRTLRSCWVQPHPPDRPHPRQVCRRPRFPGASGPLPWRARSDAALRAPDSADAPAESSAPSGASTGARRATSPTTSRNARLAGAAGTISAKARPASMAASKAAGSSGMVCTRETPAKRSSASATSRSGCDPTGPDRCLLYTSPSPRDRTRSRMPSSA